MKKSKGNIGDLMIAGICILGMTVVMLAYMESVALIHRKTEVSQLARKYILRMETVGYLTATDKTTLCQELELAGVTEINLEGTTVNEVNYGAPISLYIQGMLEGKHAFEEQRVSTAKN